MESVYRIVNTLKNAELSKRDRCTFTLQFVEYVDTEGEEEPLEVVKNSIELRTGQIFRDALNMSEGKDENTFRITADTTLEYANYIDFIKEINNGLSKEALQFCYNLYDEFYTKGWSKDAYVPTMNVRMELDCTEDGYLVEYYYYEDFENLLVYDFYSAVKERIAIKKCQLCGTYFLTQNRTDELYCSGVCRNIISKQRSKIHHRLDDENEMLKRRIASRLQQRTKVANQALREEREAVHKKFLYDVKQWKKQIKEGTATAENYKMWLQTQDLKYATMLERKEPLPAEVRPVPVIKAGNVVASAPLTPIVPEEEQAAGESGIDLDELVAEPVVSREPQPEKPQSEQIKMDIPLEEQGIPEETKARIMRFGNQKNNFAIKKAVFPTLEKESVRDDFIASDLIDESEEEQQTTEEPTITSVSLDDMKARLSAQKEVLRAQGLDELVGLLEDDERK
jgi:hypothetical protein